MDGKTTDITDEIPFDLPDSWAWCRLRTLGMFAGGKTPSTNKIEFWDSGDILWVTSKDMKTKYVENTGLKITPAGAEELQILPEGSILMVTRSGILRHSFPVAINKKECTINQDLKSLILYTVNLQEYIYNVLKAFEKTILSEYKKTGTTVESIIWDKFVQIPIPIPPFAEQQRIVEQIETLLKYVDIIDTDAETLEKSITLAKQKILDLAIRGKLVSQDPADEPASELLKKIKAEKEALVKAGKIKKDKHESYIFKGDDNCYYEQLNGKTIDITGEVPFDLPVSWSWCRLATLCDYGVCQSASPQEIPSDAWILDLEDIEKDTGKLLQRIFKQQRPPTSSKHRFIKNNVLYSKLRTYLNKVLVADMDGFCTSEILPLDFGNNILSDYARHVLMSKMFLDYTAQCGYGVKMPRLGTNDGQKALFPLPPLNEQKRIVSNIRQYEAILKELQE